MSPTRSSPRRATRSENVQDEEDKPGFIEEDVMKEVEEDETEETSKTEAEPKDEEDKDREAFDGSAAGEENAPTTTATIIDDPKVAEAMELIKNSEPQTELEIALYDTLKRRDQKIERLTGEITKLKSFISKRKQTYKRKRKESGAPTRALSAYNIFVQDRFSQLAKENEQALRSNDSNAKLRRVPPASLVASTGNEWKELSNEVKAHYEERAREDRKRYEEQMAKYQPPDKQANRKRNKTGYNMFFSAHVLRLKQTDAGVPSERGSVARLVGNAWKALSPEEKQYYEREADKQNGMNPIEKDEDEEDEEKRAPPEYMPQMQPDMQHGGMYPGMGQPGAGMAPPQHGYAPYPTHMAYGQAPYQAQHADYGSQQRYYQQQPPPPPQQQQGRAHGHQGYPPPRHPYDGSNMGI